MGISEFEPKEDGELHILRKDVERVVTVEEITGTDDLRGIMAEPTWIRLNTTNPQERDVDTRLNTSQEREVEMRFNAFRHGIITRSEQQFRVQWQGSSVPYGAVINQTEIAWTEYGLAYNTEGQILGAYERFNNSENDTTQQIVIFPENPRQA